MATCFSSSSSWLKPQFIIFVFLFAVISTISSPVNGCFTSIFSFGDSMSDGIQKASSLCFSSKWPHLLPPSNWPLLRRPLGYRFPWYLFFLFFFFFDFLYLSDLESCHSHTIEGCILFKGIDFFRVSFQGSYCSHIRVFASRIYGEPCTIHGGGFSVGGHTTCKNSREKPSTRATLHTFSTINITHITNTSPKALASVSDSLHKLCTSFHKG